MIYCIKKVTKSEIPIGFQHLIKVLKVFVNFVMICTFEFALVLMLQWLKSLALAVKILTYCALTSNKFTWKEISSIMFYTCPPHQQMPSFWKGSFEKESKYREKPVRGNVIDAFILKCFGSRNFPFDSLAKRTKKKKNARYN